MCFCYNKLICLQSVTRSSKDNNNIKALYVVMLRRMVRILVFDTETTGLPKYRNASIFRPDDWPYVVQLSFMLYDAAQNEVLDSGDYVIQLPENVSIEPGAAAVHGITDERCRREGVPMAEALAHFNQAGANTDVFVAHNIMFDKRQLMVEATRLGTTHPFGKKGDWKPDYCTMKEGTDMCRIQVKSNREGGGTYFKYPKLAELHTHIFGYSPQGLHDSMADILCCLRCYMMMIFKRDVIYDSRVIASLWRQKCISGDVILFR